MTTTETTNAPHHPIEDVARAIVHGAVTVHRELGPGLLESAYQQCLAHELRLAGLDVKCELPLPIRYRGLAVDAGYRIDMLVADQVIVENKAVERLQRIHTAQLLTYLRLSDKRLGFLLNWHVPLMKNGIHRIANHYDDPNPRYVQTS